MKHSFKEKRVRHAAAARFLELNPFRPSGDPMAFAFYAFVVGYNTAMNNLFRRNRK